MQFRLVAGGDTSGRARIRVTVNTDDPGVFATDLRNELALIAAAAESRGTDPKAALALVKDLIECGDTASFLR